MLAIPLGIQAQGLNGLHLIHLDAVDIFHDQDGPGGIVPSTPGGYRFLRTSLKFSGKLFNTAGLDQHVEFLENDALELFDQVGPAHDPAHFKITFLSFRPNNTSTGYPGGSSGRYQAGSP